MARIKTRFEEMVNDLNDGEKEMLMELMFGRSSSVSANLSSTLTEDENFNNSTTINEEDNNSVEPDLLGEETNVDLIYVDDGDDDNSASTTRKKKTTDGPPPPMVESAVGAAPPPSHHVDTFRSGASVTSSTGGGGGTGFAPIENNNNNDHHSMASDSRKSLASGSVKASGGGGGGGGGPSIVKFSTKRSRDISVANRLEGYLTLLREDYIYKQQVQANQTFASAAEMSDTTSIKSGVSSSAGGGIKKRPSTSESFTGTSDHNNDVPLHRHSSRTILSTLKSILSLVNTPSIKDDDESPLGVMSSTLPRTMLCFLHKDGIFLIMQYIMKPQDIIASTSTKAVSSSVEADRIRQATVAVSILRCCSYQLSSRRQHLLLQEHKSMIHILNCMNYYTIIEDEPQHEWSKRQDRAEGEAFMEDYFFNVSDQIELTKRTTGYRRTTTNNDNKEDDDDDDQSRSAKSDSRKSCSKKTKSKDSSATNSVLSNGSNNSAAATAAYHAATTVRNLKERKTLHEECIRAMYCLAQKATAPTPEPAAAPTPAAEAAPKGTPDEQINESSSASFVVDREIPGEVTTSPTGELSLFPAPEEEEEETATIQFLAWKRKFGKQKHRGAEDDATTTCSTSINFGKHHSNTVVGGTGDALLMVMKDLRIFFYKTSSVQKFALGLMLQIFRDIDSFYQYMNRRRMNSTSSTGPMVVTLRMNHENGGVIGADHRDRYGTTNYLKHYEMNNADSGVHGLGNEPQRHGDEQTNNNAEEDDSACALTSWQKIAPVSIWNQFICYIVDVVMRYNKYASDSTTAAAITTTNASAGTTESTTAVSSSVEIIQLGLMVIQRSVEIITHDVTSAIAPDVLTADHYALNSSNVSLDSGNNNRRSWNNNANAYYRRTSKTLNGDDVVGDHHHDGHDDDNDDTNEVEEAYLTTTMMHYIILGEPNIEECIINILREHPRNLLLIVQCMVVLHCLCTIGSTSAAATANAMYGGTGAVVPGQQPARDSSGSIASQNTLTTTTPPASSNMQPRRGSHSGAFCSMERFASSIRHVARETLAQSQHLMVLVRLLNKHKNEVLIQREGLKLLRTLQNLSSQCFIPPVPDFFWNVPMHQTILKRAYLYGKVHRGRSYTTKQLQQASPPAEVVEEEAKVITEATKQEYHMYDENYVHVSYDIGIDDDDSTSSSNDGEGGDATSSICSSSIVGGGAANTDGAAAAPLKFVGDSNANNDNDEPLSKAALRVSAIQSRSRISKSKESAKKKKQQLQAALLEQAERDQEQSLGGISNASPLSQAATTTAPKKRGPTISFFKRKKESSSSNKSTTNNNNKNISVSLGGQLRKK